VGNYFQDGFIFGGLIFSFVLWSLQAFDNEGFVAIKNEYLFITRR
jgi:hypothetical protein